MFTPSGYKDIGSINLSWWQKFSYNFVNLIDTNLFLYIHGKLVDHK